MVSVVPTDTKLDWKMNILMNFTTTPCWTGKAMLDTCAYTELALSLTLI